MINTLSDQVIATIEIDSIKLIHETRWYMEKKKLLAEYSLDIASDEILS